MKTFKIFVVLALLLLVIGCGTNRIVTILPDGSRVITEQPNPLAAAAIQGATAGAAQAITEGLIWGVLGGGCRGYYYPRYRHHWR